FDREEHFLERCARRRGASEEDGGEALERAAALARVARRLDGEPLEHREETGMAALGALGIEEPRPDDREMARMRKRFDEEPDPAVPPEVDADRHRVVDVFDRVIRERRQEERFSGLEDELGPAG